MPTLPPAVDGATAVRFDPATAAALATSLDALAWRLETAARVEDAAFGRAIADWAGPTRRWAEERRLAVREETVRAAGRCRDAAEEARRSVLAAAIVQHGHNADEHARRRRNAALLELAEVRVP
ncbi:MAG TPA: hypothetical protein VHK88_04920 [Aquihabitans sp.]|jgi:hypothetical protein|nr:hypothetical protein [Aquihabitans sp.]